MPTQINSNYSANFQKFVDFARNAYATTGENTVVRFSGMPRGDYQGAFASFWRTSEMKAANDQVRDLFRKTVADMFGGERNIPDIVRDNMKLEDFGQGKPLTARRINLVKTAIDIVGGGKFTSSANVEEALSMGYMKSELPKLARVANLYQQATGCTDEEAEKAALDPGSNARRLFDCGGRFTLNAENFKKGLALMDQFAGWYGNLQDDFEAGKRDTVTKLNLQTGICNRKAATAVQKFLMEEIAVNSKIPLDATNPEDVFGMAKNPAMRFVGRNYTMSFANSLAQIPPEKRSVLYAVFDALDKLPDNEAQLANRQEIGQNAILGARVMKHFDAIVALQATGKLDRAHLIPLLYSELQIPADASNKEIGDAVDAKLISGGNFDIVQPLHMLAETSGATLDEAAEAIRAGRQFENAPGISSANGHLEELDGTATGGRTTMIGDLNRPSMPMMIGSKTPVLSQANAKFVFNFPDGVTLAAKTGRLESKEVRDSCDAIADKLRELCGEVHVNQLSNVYFALSQSGIGGNIKHGLEQYGISSDEHMPVTFTLSRNDETGAVTIKYSEPEGLPVKFNWTTTIDVDGNAVTTPMRVDHGQYEAEAMEHADTIASKMPGKDKAAAETLIKDMLAHCGDDFDLKEIVSKNISSMCVTATSTLRTADQIKAKIDAVAANFAELKELSKGNPAIYEAGMRMMAAMGGKSLPAGMIGRIAAAAANAPVDAIRNLSARSSGPAIHRAVTQLRDGLVAAMDESGAERETGGPDEKQACRNFVAALMMARCGVKALRDMQGAFGGDTASKLLSLYVAIGDGKFNGGIERQIAIRLEDQGTSHMTHLGTLKDVIDLAADGRPGTGLAPFRGQLDPDEIDGGDIYHDLLDIASR